MKTVLLFIIFLIIGFGVTFLLISKKTTPDITKPKVLATIPASKFSLEKAPSQSLFGDITSMSGEIKWQSRTATETAVITTKQTIQQGESIETGKKGQVSLAFPNLLMTLSSDTKVNIIQTLPDHIVLEQESGETHYENTSASPVAIRISPILIQLQNSKATILKDDDAGTISIKAENGSPTVAYNDSDNVSTVLKVPTGKTLVFDTASRTSRIK